MLEGDVLGQEREQELSFHLRKVIADTDARGPDSSGGAASGRGRADAPRVVPESGYGITETCSHQYTPPDDPPERIIETCGRACEGFEIRIRREP